LYLSYTAVNEYESALASFFQCMSIPANSLSGVVVCAIKKARLVALIHYGKDIVTSMYVLYQRDFRCVRAFIRNVVDMTLPCRHLSGVVVRFLKQPMAGYDNLVRAFLQNDRSALEATIVAEQETLAQDQNVGLAHRVLVSLTRHRLKRLAATFISLSLSEIARRVELPDVAAAEKEVLKLASAGEITARIDTATGFVRFEADGATAAAATATDALLNPASGRLLETCLRQTVELSEKLREMQRGTVTSHRYLVKNTTAAAGVRGFGQGGSATVGPEGMMGMGMGVNSSMYDRMIGDF
jgi:hypothetical protein